ncbi:zinc-dependent alcohol dehydrogenase family protein [uncultured Jatrophihabitans sp.]|uniref:zinc-dependent alcohol dehydrogenase family protein n=1 Tax=uncultured Jatrophihabitans sp. TaxID=1610747 RepID=UPI0035CBDB17
MDQAWIVDHPRPIDDGPLRRIEREVPQPGAGQVRVRVVCCGVCRTDLHLAEGDLAPHRPRTTPGHEIVGVVDAVGDGVRRFSEGDRIGVAWLAGTDGTCAYCRSGRENLCREPVFTGWDVDGGYADHCLADEAFVYPLPDAIDDEQAAPLLCAGIIGYRALLRADVPRGGSLGIYGFGGSAHLTAQLALHEGTRVHVLTRGAGNQDLARRLGADSVGGADDEPPEPLDSAILFAPAGELVPVALRALAPGGTLAVAGIWLSDIPPLDYAAELFEERQLRSVTANTRADGEQFLRLAARHGIRATTTAYPMAEADRALADLAHGRFSGAAGRHTCPSRPGPCTSLARRDGGDAGARRGPSRGGRRVGAVSGR